MDPEPERTRAFGERLLAVLTGGMLTMMIDIGHRTGLLGGAGFTDVQVLDSTRPQNCIYVCRAVAQ